MKEKACMILEIEELMIWNRKKFDPKFIYFVR